MIALDRTTHDLALDAAGRFVEVTGPEATAQAIKVRLLHVKGEWFADTSEGVPWLTDVLVKGVDLGHIRAIVREVIQGVPGVVDVPDVSIALDRATRRATIAWSARLDSGAVIRSTDYGPNVVSG